MEKNDEVIKKIMEEFGYNRFMAEQLIINYPEDYMAVINAFEKPPRNTIRVNTLYISPAELKRQLEQKGFKLRPTQWIDYGFHVNIDQSKYPLGATHEYLLGYYYLQSLGSMIPVHILSPQPGENILDMCAAPGSKTTQIGQLLKGKGKIIAVDIKETRIESLISNLNRCGIENAIAFTYDARFLKRIPKLINWPDKILLDAPCTGSGVIRKDRSRKTSRKLDDVKIMSKLQLQLLDTGLDLLKPKGLLVYSTCSFHYHENELVISKILEKRDDIEILEPPFADIGLPGLIEAEGHEFGYEMLKTRRIYPNLHDTDAFFYCLIKKKY